MSSVEAGSAGEAATASVKAGDFRLEVVVLPVSDVERAKEFYGRLGWRLDADVARGEDFRLVQFTPPGSGCSIQFGTNIASGAPGSAQSLYLAVPDVEAAREELRVAGIELLGEPGPTWQHFRGPDRNVYELVSRKPS